MAGLFDGFEGHRVLAGGDVDRAVGSALVAVDANVLLNLYRYKARTSDDLLTVLERLGDRLVVPHQVVREFHRNRLAAIGNPGGASREVLDALAKNQRSTADALCRWAKQVALAEVDLAGLLDEVGRVYGSVAGAVGSAEPDRVHASTPAAEDRVLDRLTAVLEGKVLAQPPEREWAEMIAEGKRRVEEQRPPGYLDAGKGDHGLVEGAAGDYLVFRQACEAAAGRGLDLVIVTGDEKEDWWWRHRSVVVGPRPEMTKEYFDLSGGRQLFLLRPGDLLARSAALDVVISPESVVDAGRVREELAPAGSWTAEAVAELLDRLDAEGLAHAEVIKEAAARGGVVDRETVYEIGGYDDERMLRGFTRPTARITADLQRLGLLPEAVTPMLTPIYPDGMRASGFRIPSEVVSILQFAAEFPDDEDDGSVTNRAPGKYWPLTRWLATQTGELPMSFADLEQVLGSPLAPSAHTYPQYWHSTSNSLGKAIAAGGYRPRHVDLTAGTVQLVPR